MTTIIYDQKSCQIAIDSRSVSGSVIINDKCKKWKEINGSYYFFAGVIADIEHFIELENVKGKPDFVNSISCIKVTDSIAYLCGIDDDEGYWQEKMDSNDGTGSGRFFALSALDFGKTAKEAVEYAATRDVYTGGKPCVFDVISMKFIKSYEGAE
jgi:ATP-dependent protease HslVU (ClpYQ) peptidase subunit